MSTRRVELGRRNYGLDFSNLNDGIDWRNALPPNVVAERARQHVARSRAPRSTMFMEWPIAEDAFGVPPSIAQVRELTHHLMGTLDAPSRRVQRSAMDIRRQTSPASRRMMDPRAQFQRSGQSATQVQLRQPQASAPSGDLSFLAQVIDNIGSFQTETFPSFEPTRRVMETIADTTLSMEETMMSMFPFGLRAFEENSNDADLRLQLELQSSGLPRGLISRDREPGVWRGRGRAQPFPRRHVNRSGAEYDIITNLSWRPTTNNNGTMRQTQGSDSPVWEITDFSYENLLRLDNTSKPVGLPQHQLRAMKPLSYASIQKRNSSGKNATKPTDVEVICAICLEKLVPHSMVLDLGCGHVFHHSCIIQWLTRSTLCPTCRHEVPRKGRAL